MFKGRRPILSPLMPRSESAHPGRVASFSLPRPYKKHRAELKRALEMQDTSIDQDRFRYTVADKDARVRCQPQGVICIHILELTNVSIRVTKFNEQAPIFFYCLVSIGTTRRMSKVVQSDTRQRVRMDSTIYFSLEISEIRDDYRNKLRIELWAFQEPEYHYIIGSKEVHIYRIIQTVHGIETKLLWADGLLSASATYEYAFSYGVFGYGHSDQLRNTDRSIFESVNNSLFPRIRLSPEDVIDNRYNTRIPIKLQNMSVNSFIFEGKDSKFYTEKDSTSNPVELVEPRFFTVHQTEFDSGIPVYCKINMSIYQTEFEADFNDFYGEYVCLTSRKDRIEYLRGLLAGRFEDLVESDVGPLFMDLQEGVLERVIDADMYSGHRIYPTKRPCMEYGKAVILKEDEPFLSQFPSTSWSPGWLARVFGYTEQSTDPHYGEGDYPVIEAKEEIIIKRSCPQKFIFQIKYIWNRITKAMYEIVYFIFPEIGNSRQIPEISVTLTSPEGSTTDLYVQWINEELEHPLRISEKNAAQETNLVSIHVDKESDMESDSEEETGLVPQFKLEDSDVLKIEDFED